MYNIVMSSGEVACHNCTAACCRAGTVIMMSSTELPFMLEKGAKLHVSENGRRFGLLAPFVLDEDCPWLNAEGLCEAYDNPERPQLCQTFEAGSDGCLDIRRARAVPLPDRVIDLSGIIPELIPEAA